MNHCTQKTYQRLHCTVESMSVVSSELWVGAVQRWISRGLWLLDTAQSIRVSLLPFRKIIAVATRGVCWTGGLWSGAQREVEFTHFGEPSSTDYAETSSWILFSISSLFAMRKCTYCSDTYSPLCWSWSMWVEWLMVSDIYFWMCEDYDLATVTWYYT
jgi:hypothetical protein